MLELYSLIQAPVRIDERDGWGLSKKAGVWFGFGLWPSEYDMLELTSNLFKRLLSKEE